MRSVMPSPRAIPLASWVLPAPKSPDNPMTRPLTAARPQVSPSACVSSALCEMLVTMRGQRPGPFLVADGDAFAGGDFADARKLELGKLFFPRIKQWHGVAAGNGEQKLEILAVCERGEERRLGGPFRPGGESRGPADGNACGEKFRSDAAGFDEVAQIAREPIAEIDHGMD